MTYALDTNIISFLLRADETVSARWRQERIAGNTSTIPLVAYYEVKRGLISVNATTKLKNFERLCELLGVDDLSIEDANTASRIYSKLRKAGRLIDDSDLLIAAQCLTRSYTLVTNNTKHFENVDGRLLEDWTVEL